MKSIKTRIKTAKQSWYLRLTAWVAGFLFLWAGTAQAQLAPLYPLTISAGTYTSISGTGTSVPDGDDVATNLSFTPSISINSINYSNARMCSNGWLALFSGAAPTPSGQYTPLSTAMANGNVIFAPFGRDLNSDLGGNMYYQIIGSEVVFEWQNMNRYGYSDVLNFQVRLNTSTGDIKFVYGTMTPAASTTYPQVGWKTNGQVAGNWQTDINNIMIDNVGSNAGCTWANAVTGRANSNTAYFNSANAGLKPASGLTFTWKKPLTSDPAPVREFAAVSGITSTTATISWTAPANATQYNVQYRITGDCNWTNFTGNPVAGTSATLTGLTGSTSYQVRVQSSKPSADGLWSHVPPVGGGNGTNGYNASGTFITSCVDISVFPHTETFNSPIFAPTCWQNNQVSGTGLWQRTAAGANPTVTPIGAGMPYFNCWSYSVGVSANLVSRSLNLPSNNYRVRFKMYRDTYYSADDEIKVYYNTAPNLTGATLLGTIRRERTQAPAESGADGWYDYQFNFPGGSMGAGRYVIFNAYSDWGANIFIDEVVIEEQPLCNPPTPSSLTATPVTNTTANISWAAAAPVPSSYEYWVSTSATPPPSGTNTAGLSVAGVTATNGVTNYLHVRSNCGVNGFSAWATYSFYMPPAGQIGPIEYSNALPIQGCWDYSYSQTLYYTNELNYATNGGTTPYITRVRYYYGTATLTPTDYNNWTIWMAHTNKPSFTGASDWIANSNFTQVFNGTVTFPGGGNWVEFILNTPFLWNGTDNIAIAVRENQVGWDCTPGFGIFDTPSLVPNGRSLITYRDNTPYDPNNPGSANGWYYSANTLQLVSMAPPACSAPSALNATPSSPSAATISWTAPVTPPSNGYEYVIDGTAADPSGAGTPTPFVSVAGAAATPGATQYLHVRSNCGGSGYSNWITWGPWVQPCNAVNTFPFTETFETSSPTRNCWTVNNYVTGTVNWTYGAGSGSGFGPVTTAYMGSTNAQFYSPSYAGNTTRLVSPAFDLSSMTAPKLTFYHAQPSWVGDQDELRVYYKTSLLGSWTLLATYTTDVSAWTKRDLALPSPTGDYYIAFEGKAFYGYGIGVDQVTIKEPTCFDPTNPAVAVNTPTDVNISWGLPLSGTPSGYEYWVSTSATPPGSGTATGGLSVNNVTATANVINYLHVRTWCGGADYSDWVTFPFVTSYCPVAATTYNTHYITNVTTTNALVNINNNSTYQAGGYQDFTGVAVNQYPGEDINITLSYISPGGAGLSVYIDWNNDLDFDDVGEWIASSNAYLYTGQANTIFNVPVSAPLGAHRVRIVFDWLSMNPTACGTITTGEYEDYTLNVIPIPSCTSASWASTYTTSTTTPLVCTGQLVDFTQAPIAPVATGITYRLEFSTAIAGPYSPVGSPQANSTFMGITPSNGFYRIVTLCNGSPIAATWTPVGIVISDPTVANTTPASNCGPGSLTLGANQTPAAATLVWYDSPLSTTVLGTGPSFTTPVINTTTTYYVQAQNLLPTADIGTSVNASNATIVTPFSTLWESHRQYYLVRKSELNNAGITSGDLTSLAFYVTTPGGMAMQNMTMRLATTTAANLNLGFGTATSAFTTVYTTPSEPIPAANAWKTFSFSAPFNWNGTDNLIIEICHYGTGWATSSTVRYTQTTFNSVCGIYQDGINLCGANDPVDVLNNNRPNMRFAANVSTCNSVRVPVVATINSLPTITGPSNQTFAPTPFSFNPLPLVSSTITPGSVVTYTPASGIYVDNNTTALYVANTNINNVTQYFAPLSTITYSAVATAPNGCSASHPFTITVDISGMPNDACSAANVNTTSGLAFFDINTLGAPQGVPLPCGGVNTRMVWYKTTVPSSGEVHVVTKQKGTDIVDLTATKVALFTSTSCTGLSNTACDGNTGPGEFTYAFTQATPGSTVYIRVSGVTGSPNEVGRAQMAVTSHLVWAPTNGDDASLAENWQAGDATALTTPSALKSIFVPSSVVKPRLTANTAVRGVTLNAAPPYFISQGINLNGFDLGVAGNWNMIPANGSANFTCGGNVIFNGPVAQTIGSGKTNFGNFTLNNPAGLTINSQTGVNCVLKTISGNLTTGGKLVLRSSAANTAALVDPTGGGTITGDASVERKIGSTSGYHYLSAAVSGANVNNTTTGWRDDFTILAALDNMVFIPGQIYSQLPSVWEYQEFVNNPIPEYGWVSATSATDPITPLKGFACVVPGNTVVDVFGPLNNGAVPSYSITLTDNGLNLLGNPYPSPISWNLFRTTNGSALATTGYKAFVSSGGYVGNYGTWDGSTGTLGVTDRIASSQAFFATGLGNTTVTAANTNRLISPADVIASFFGYNYVADLLRLDFSGNGYTDQMAVYFSDSRSDAFDNDATKLNSPVEGVPSIYTLAGNEHLSINAMGALNMEKVVPVGVNIKTAGTYTFGNVDMSTFAPSVIAYLEDVQTGTVTNLRAAAYSVTLPAGAINNRFFIHFHPAVELNAVNETCIGNDGQLMINYPASSTVNVVIKNAAGAVVSTLNNVSGAVTVNNLAAGNYAAEMTFGVAPNFYTTTDYFTVGGSNALYANLSASASSVDMAANTTVNFTATAQGATSFNWNFGDGTVITNGPANVSHTFTHAGNYTVSFEASNGSCTATASTALEVTNATGLTALAAQDLKVYGLGDKVTIQFGNKLEGNGSIEVINMLGEVISHLDQVPMKGNKEIQLSNIAAGQYMVKIVSNNKLFTDKVYLSRQ